MTINVVVHGVMGKMGQQVLETVTNTLGHATCRSSRHHGESGHHIAA